MTALSEAQKTEFLDKHFRHRLTILRTLSKRVENGEIRNDDGSVYRCIKDCNLIAVRLLLDFLGLRGAMHGNDFILETNHNKKNKNDDVKINDFPPCKLLEVNDVPINSQRILAGVYKRADKELAHLTKTYNEEFNDETILIEAAKIIVDLIDKFLYQPLGKSIPDLDV